MIKNEDASVLMICSIRYCLGRHTYMPSLIQEVIKKNIKKLTDNDLKVMIRDISEYLKHDSPFIYTEPVSLADFDTSGWRDFLDFLNTENSNRYNLKNN